MTTVTTLTTVTRLKRPRNPGSTPIIPSQWKRLTLDAKLFYLASALDVNRNAHVFTVNFTWPTCGYLEKSTQKLKSVIAQRLRDHLPPVPLAFTLETNIKGRLHIHGLLDPTKHDIKDIMSCLKTAAGDARKLTTSSERHFVRRYAVDLKPANWTESYSYKANIRFGPYGWAYYMIKDLKRTRKHLETDDSLLCVNRLATKVARRLYEEDLLASRSYKAA